MTVKRAHAFSAGTVANPLPADEAACPECDRPVETAWSPAEALAAMMFDETAGLVRVVCQDDECGWQGSAQKAKT